MPGTRVSIALNGPPFAWPGLRSNVSIWLGPPAIHSRMHERLRCGGLAEARAASDSIQPDAETPAMPADMICIQRRRERLDQREVEGVFMARNSLTLDNLGTACLDVIVKCPT